MSKALSLRRKGQLPLSVATSIAIESLLNMTPTEDASPHVRVPKGDRNPLSTSRNSGLTCVHCYAILTEQLILTLVMTRRLVTTTKWS